MTTGWTLFIAIVTAINIVGCVWLLLATSRRSPGDMQPGAETTGHTWDGDLREYNNPLPRWWLWLFYGSVVFAIGYMVLYPGIGSFGGTLGWSQHKQWEEQVAAAEAASAPVFARFASMELGELAADPDAMRVARNLYANNCAMCHGSDARGATGFPNLTDGDWLYGGDADTLLTTLSYGRNGIMPPWGEALGEQGVEDVAAYVLTLSGQSAPADRAAAGKPKFEMYCAACHGIDGTGMQALGAPNLTDDTWLYGSGIETIRYGIVNGRNNMMPAQLENLGEDRIRLLAAYVMSISPRPAPVAEEATEVAGEPVDGAADDAG